MGKIRYEIDPHNRLVAQDTGEKSDLNRFRAVLDGQFKIGPKNCLIYHIKSPIEGVNPDRNSPHQVKLTGRWSLTENHDLRLTLNKWRRQIPGDELTLQGEIIEAEKNSLLFAVTTRTKEDTATTYILKLEGAWQADEQNRLSFRLKKDSTPDDTLIFDGIWEVNKNHQIIYHYEKSRLKKDEKKEKTITFKGFWDIKDKYSLSYKLDLDGKSAFDFKTGIGILDKDRIKYELGIGIADKERPVRRVVTLFGSWRLKKDVGLLFEIEYEKGKIQAITFGADAKLSERDAATFNLKNTLGKELGMELVLSRKLVGGDGEAFLRLLKSNKEAAIYIGQAWRW